MLLAMLFHISNGHLQSVTAYSESNQQTGAMEQRRPGTSKEKSSFWRLTESTGVDCGVANLGWNYDAQDRHPD